MNRTTIDKDTDALTGVIFAIGGGKFRVRLREEAPPGRRWGSVLDDAGEVIGTAQDGTYGGSGWCIWTSAYHGYATLDQVVLVGEEGR